MTEVIGVRFRTSTKVYYFAPAGFDVKRGNYVVVETARGVEMGKVVMPPKNVEDSEVVAPLREILRVASAEDIEQSASYRAKEKSAFHVCKEKIRAHELDMKLIEAEYTFDGTKLIFYFTADGRVDFRELVKDLAGVFKTRIELRQIGVRDETKILGGYGICGRELCCHSYLTDFVPVSIKMAKEQNLSLNAAKISGTCGRLMCCLKNEEDIYEELNRKLPSVKDIVTTSEGVSGQVISVDVLRQKVRIIIEKGDEKEIAEYLASELTYRPRKGHRDKKQENAVELDELIEKELEKELEELEKQDAVKTFETEGEQEHHKKNNNHNRHNRKNLKEHSRENHKEGSRENPRDNSKEGSRENRKRNFDRRNRGFKNGERREKNDRGNASKADS